MADSPDDLLTLREAAAVLGVQVNRVRDMLDSHRIPGEKDSRGYWMVRRGDVDTYAAARPRRPLPISPDAERELVEYQQRITATQDQVSELIDKRNRAIVRWNAAGCAVRDLSRVMHLGRQQVNTIIRETRALIAEEAARANQQ